MVDFFPSTFNELRVVADFGPGQRLHCKLHPPWVVPSYPRQNVGDPNGGIFKAQLILGAGKLTSWAAQDDMENLRVFPR